MTSERPAAPASLGEYRHTPTLAQMNLELRDGYSSWISVTVCPVCSSPATRPFAELRHIKHSRCTACGLVFVNPVPPDSVLNALYNSASYDNYRRLEAAQQRHDRYFSISAYTDQRDLARWLTASHPRSVLDFGCGTGNFLALLRDEFGVPHVEGLEVNEKSLEIARRNYDLDLATDAGQLRKNYYDAAVLLEVIEHVTDARGVMKLLAEHVRVGGYLLVTTPAVDGFVARRLPSQCPHYTAPGHVTLFTERSLRELLMSSGFEPIEVRVDVTTSLFGPALRSLFYDLDFMSPANDDDTNDSWWTPTRFGRFLGRTEGRSSRLPFHLRGAMWIADEMLNKVSKAARKPEHLYIMARKLP